MILHHIVRACVRACMQTHALSEVTGHICAAASCCKVVEVKEAEVRTRKLLSALILHLCVV